MAKPKQTSSGKWSIGLRHPSLPGGRKYFTFDTELEAVNYAQQWKLMKMADISPPAELLKSTPKDNVILAHLIRAWINSGLAAPSQMSPLGSLLHEVGSVRLVDANYTWLSGYVRQLKVKNNLSPTSIKHRVQALSRSIDEYLRHHPDLVVSNPTKLLPKGYSTYTELDARLVQAAGKKVKETIARDRRLFPGEDAKIVAVLSGFEHKDRQRGLQLKGGNALLTMYLLIVNSGLRLKEAYTLTRGQIDMDAKVMRVQSSKQWRGKVVFRDVPMRPEVHAALVPYLAGRPMLPSAYLFPFMDEEPGLDVKKVSQRLSFRFKLAFKYMDIEGLHEHDLRHEATCRWLELKDATGNWMFRLEEINRIMGWSSNSTMAQRYASFRGADLAQRMWATPAPAAPAASAARADAA